MSRYGKCLDCGEAVVVNDDGLRSECACDRRYRDNWSKQIASLGQASYEEAWQSFSRYWHSQCSEEEAKKVQVWFNLLG